MYESLASWMVVKFTRAEGEKVTPVKPYKEKG